MGGRSGQSTGGSSGGGAAFGGDTFSITSKFPEIELSVYDGTFPKGINALKALELTGLNNDFNGKVSIEPSFGDTVIVKIEGNGLRMDRVIRIMGGDKYISNNYFKIAENSLYAGKSLEIFSNQVKNAAKSGFSRIEVMAAGSPNDKTYNGYYTWAAYGYKPSNASSLVGKIFDKTGSNYGTWENMMKSKLGRADFKQYGQGWSGSFDLKKGSDSIKQLAAYSKDRKANSKKQKQN